MNPTGHHQFLPTSGAKYCHICQKAKSDAIHSWVPTDLMPRATDDNHETEDLQQGDVVYIDAGSVKLTVYRACDVRALQKLQAFLTDMIVDRP